MKKIIFLLVTIFSMLGVFGQDKKLSKKQLKAIEKLEVGQDKKLSKKQLKALEKLENKKALEELKSQKALKKLNDNIKEKLEARISFPVIDVKDSNQKIVFKNESSAIKFKNISKPYTDQIENIGPYLFSTLIPLLNVGQVKTDSGQSIVYFPIMLVNWNRTAGKLSAAQKFIIPQGASISELAYKFETENGSAIIFEFIVGRSYSYGLILETKLDKLLARIGKQEIGIMTDSRDNRTYKWVKIGDQNWFGENLKFNTGEVKRDKNMEVMAYSNYFGRYYNFSQAISSCPEGWHLPSDGEWKELELEIGLNPEFLDYIGTSFRPGFETEFGANNNTFPGTDLKSSEELMFFARHAGVLGIKKYGNFELYRHREVGYYWTSSKADESTAILRCIGSDYSGIVRDKAPTKTNYFSCRCVENRDLSSMIKNSPKLIEITTKITEAPNVAGNYFDRSIEFFLNGEANLAVDDINKAIELDGNDLEQKLFKAQILFNKSYEKDADEIRQLVAEYTAVNMENDFAYFFECRLALYDSKDGVLKATSDNERIKKGLISIDKALAIDPQNPYYNDYRARILVILGEYKSAINALNKQLEVDTKNGDTYYLLGLMKLRYNNQQNRKINNANAFEWCTLIGGACFKVTSTQLKQVCRYFTKAINYGKTISPDYMSLCGELKQAETLQKHKPIVYTGPRGGRYTLSSGGNKVYIPRR